MKQTADFGRLLAMLPTLLLAVAAPLHAERLLEALEWKHRTLVVFAEGSRALDAQLQAIEADRAGFEERDLVLVRVAGDTVVAGLSDEARALTGADAMRSRFHPQDPFTAVLVGKDGTEKLRSSEPIPMSRLFSVIDRMPMRLREMQAGSKSAGAPTPKGRGP